VSFLPDRALDDRPPRTAIRRGSWGTSRQSERLFGYPAPRRGPTDDLERRIEALEDAMEALWRREDGR
jgi:hypothetical protein